MTSKAFRPWRAPGQLCPLGDINYLGGSRGENIEDVVFQASRASFSGGEELVHKSQCLMIPGELKLTPQNLQLLSSSLAGLPARRTPDGIEVTLNLSSSTVFSHRTALT